MSKTKDPAIKLFGKTIQLLNLEQQKYCSGDIKITLKKQHVTSQTEDTCSNQSTSSGTKSNNDDPKTPTTENETSSKNITKKDTPIANPNKQEKPRKPDKILPCPRCNSLDTKFCYYNNYNVNQPRHFCKNCQRYWTAGGTMRNTPVGSGRRKNKSSLSSSYYRHLIISDTSLKTNGSVLNFGSDIPLCESMNQALKFCDKPNKPEDDHSNLVEKGGNNGLGNLQKYPLQIPCFPPPPPPPCPCPCPCTWNSTQYRPVSFYPKPQYWGCAVQVQPTPWSMPCITPPNDQIAPTSTLGKHSRDKDLDSGVLIPKTLRIKDPNEAAKSSLWSTLGISKEDSFNNLNNGGNVYKPFQFKSDEKNEVVASSLVNLQANPAALSRSLNFWETS